MGNIDHQRFIGLLKGRFPEVVAMIDDCSEGLLHPEMGTFARATQQAIDRQDESTVRAHFQFIDEVFRNAAPDVENAVYVSYLENLRLDVHKDGATRARELLPPRMQRALTDLETYLDRLFAGEKPSTPPHP
jgi:hypothetical protein